MRGVPVRSKCVDACFLGSFVEHLAPPLGTFDAVSSGKVEMAHSAAAYWVGRIPAAPFFTSIPFGLDAFGMRAWLTYGGGQQLWDKLYEPYGVFSLQAGNTGIQMGGWYNKEINTAADLEGLKMRIPGLGGQVMTELGATVQVLPGGEIYQALETGAIDATEWVGPYDDRKMDFHKVTKYYYYPGWHEPGPTLESIVNKQAWESLPEDLQMMIETASRAVNEDMLSEFTARNNAALRRV